MWREEGESKKQIQSKEIKKEQKGLRRKVGGRKQKIQGWGRDTYTFREIHVNTTKKESMAGQ